MKVLQVVLSIAGTLYFAGCMFFSLMAGIPEWWNHLNRYTFYAAGFSLLFPLFTCLCVNYAIHLQNKIIELEKKIKE